MKKRLVVEEAWILWFLIACGILMGVLVGYLVWA